MTTFVEVETADFAEAARSMYDEVAEPVRGAVLALNAALDGSGAMAGSDEGGQAWAVSYDRAARAALRAGQDVGNGCYRLAAMFAQSARNYEAADAASSARSRHVEPGRLPYDTSFGTGALPPSASGGSGDPPALWGMVEHLVGYVWPDGHQDRLQATAAAWDRAAATADAHAFGAGLVSVTFARDRLPEADDMITVCQGMNGHLRELASVYRSLAGSCRDLAGHIDAVHAAVETETWDLAWQTGAIEGVGFVAGLFSFGLAELPAQAIEGWRLAAIAARIAELIRTFVAAARALAQTVAALADRASLVTARLRAILGARLAAASVAVARRYPVVGAIGEQVATLRLALGFRGGVLVHIDDPKKFDPFLMEGMTMSRVRASIPKTWARGPSKSGGGTVFKDPLNRGRQIRLMPGYGRGSRPSSETAGPYAVVSQAGAPPVKVLLAGNSELR